jgi:uncharacterized membrane protein
MAEEREHGLEQAMGRMLQIGVTVAALVVLAGGILYLLQSGGAKPDYAHFQAAPAAVTTVSGILASAAKMDPRGVIGFGLLLLIATPIGRVIFGVVGFARLRDWLYTGVSVIVLAILLYSFVVKR